MFKESINRIQTMALIHDLPESAITDIPTPAQRYFPAGAKRHAELNAMAEMLDGFSCGERLQAWWREFEEGSSVEGRLVRDADRLELLLQAYVYERSRAKYLDEFWAGQDRKPFEFEAAQNLFQALKARRDSLHAV